jgi:hypothetical protein
MLPYVRAALRRPFFDNLQRQHKGWVWPVTAKAKPLEILSANAFLPFGE